MQQELAYVLLLVCDDAMMFLSSRFREDVRIGEYHSAGEYAFLLWAISECVLNAKGGSLRLSIAAVVYEKSVTLPG